jgi:hypothetical protein
VAEIPDLIVVGRDRDLVGRSWEIWVRRALFSVLPIVVLLALLNVFGIRPSTASGESSAAKLEVYAPSRVHGGDLFEARFRIDAHTQLENATVVLDPGWLEGMTVNSIAPSPEHETSANGRLSLSLGDLPAGRTFLLFVYFQVNPTNVGHRSRKVELFDGDTKLLEIDRSITVFP